MNFQLLRLPNVRGWLLAIAIGCAAGQPYLVGKLVNGSDTYYHLHRLWQLDVMVRQGIWFPRWSPDLAYGFGYPVFQFYGPLSYQIAEVFYWLSGYLTTGYWLALALFTVAAAVGAYFWTHDILGELGGLVAAAAYSFTPYLASNILIRGASAEACAFAAMPFVLGATQRVARGRIRFMGIGAIAYATLALSHNATFFLFTPALLAYAAFISITRYRADSSYLAYSVSTLSEAHSDARSRRARLVSQLGIRSKLLVRILLMMIWGIALAAFYILPAFAERNFVQLDKLVSDPTLDFHNNFIPLSLLFANPFPYDPQALGYPYPLHIGFTPVLLMLFGLVVFGVSLWGPHRVFKSAAQEAWIAWVPHILAALLIIVACVFMMAPSAAAVSVWESLPVLGVLQFQRRFLPIAGLFAAFIIGMGCTVMWGWLKRTRLGLPVTAAMLCALWVTVFPLQQTPHTFSRSYAPTGESIMRLEHEYGVIGTTTTGEYLPVAVKQIPPIELSPLLRANASRLNESSLPADTKIMAQQYAPLHYDVTLQAPSTFVVQFTTFYYAGWQAVLDGAPANIEPSDPHGFIGVQVPAGQHRLQIYFGTTPLRQLGEGVSGLALALLVISTVWMMRKQPQQKLPRESKPGFSEKPGLDSRQALVLFVVLAALFAFKSLVVDKQTTPWAYSRFNGQSVSGLSHPADANFNNTLVFLGADLPTQASSNSTLTAHLYWRAVRKLESDYSVSLQLVDANGVTVGQSDHQHPADNPTRTWAETQYARDTHDLKIYPATPPGEYILRVSVYPYGASDKPQPLVNASGLQAEVGRVQVTRPQFAAAITELQPRFNINKLAAPNVLLLGYDAPDSSARPGDRVPITLYWQASEKPDRDLQFQFVLSKLDEAPVSSSAMPLVLGYASTQWQRGDVWRAPHALLLPANLTSGQYQLAVQMDGAAPVELGALTLNAPEHILTAPPVAVPQSATFGEVAELIGFDAASDAKANQPFEVKLIWKALRETKTPYKVFVHVLNASGQQVAGDDAAPAQWQRPTTGWVSGEYITDPHVLTLPAELPAGTYTLQVGLYEDGGSNQRLGEPVKLKHVFAVQP